MAKLLSRGARSARRSALAEYVGRFGHRAILEGVDARSLKEAIGEGVLRQDEVQRFIPASTLARKVREGRKLARDEADQIARLLRLKAYAFEVFESIDIAETWLRDANPALGNQPPTDLLATDEGSRAVETVLRRIDYGDYS